ncbi:MAG TPA: hypothetical protein VLF87_00165 [Patescibacteria group bacterium]|nr:hypothetical protein [Patescibacteria group bacterium]
MQPQEPTTPGIVPPNQPFQPYPIQPGVPPPTPGVIPSPPKKHHPWVLIISLTLVIILFFVAASIAIWAFMSRQDYKDNSDKKAAAAASIAVQQEDSSKEKEFLEREKQPYKTYSGPETYGSLSITYPKTWSAYVVQTDRSSIPIDGYLHPNFVPGSQSGTAFALRIQVTSQSYDTEMKQFEGKVKTGTLKVSPVVLKNVPNVTGSRVEGEINIGQKDVMVLLPLRDKTIKISTESQDYVKDFDGVILPNFKFVP